MTRAAFIDRDGVLNQLVGDEESGGGDSPMRPDEVELIDGAIDALHRFAAAGFLLVGVSNQPAAAKGRVPLSQLEAVQERVVELLAQVGVRFDDFRICHHHPRGVVAELARPCDCRKPAPGMLLAAAERLGIDLAASWTIGDSDTDVAAGRAAGTHTLLIENQASARKRVGGEDADGQVADLAAAATFILARDAR